MDNQMEKELLTQTILEMNGCKAEEVGTYIAFESKKAKIREIMEEISDSNQEMNRRKGLLMLILERRQKLQFYLVETADHHYQLPKNCDLNNPESFETLMLFDELAGVLEEIAQQEIQKQSSIQLDENLMRILGMLNEAPYEKLDQVLESLLVLTER